MHHCLQGKCVNVWYGIIQMGWICQQAQQLIPDPYPGEPKFAHAGAPARTRGGGFPVTVQHNYFLKTKLIISIIGSRN